MKTTDPIHAFLEWTASLPSGDPATQVELLNRWSDEQMGKALDAQGASNTALERIRWSEDRIAEQKAKA